MFAEISSFWFNSVNWIRSKENNISINALIELQNWNFALRSWHREHGNYKSKCNHKPHARPKKMSSKLSITFRGVNKQCLISFLRYQLMRLCFFLPCMLYCCMWHNYFYFKSKISFQFNSIDWQIYCSHFLTK